MKKAFVTGYSGFIGYHLSQLLLDKGYEVLGIDNFNDYYEVSIKEARSKILESYPNFTSVRGNIESPGILSGICKTFSPNYIIHLAAQAGVRYSIDNPKVYFDSNLLGTFELLEAAKECKPQHLLMASTSSAYGANDDYPHRENQKSDHPMSFYAATKKSCEVISHSYSHIHEIPITAFRFFTVYGPWGRPDMALFKFTKAILEGKVIDIYNYGKMKRDFTYVVDLVSAIESLLNVVPKAATQVCSSDSISDVAPMRVVNIGNGKPVELTKFIEVIETKLNLTARKNFMEIQPGDVPETFADNSVLKALIGKVPETSIEQGIDAFINWYKKYYDSK